MFYVGSTADLRGRIASHRLKEVPSTKRYDKLKLVYYEACLCKADSIRREGQLKTGFGRGFIKRRLEVYLKNMRD